MFSGIIQTTGKISKIGAGRLWVEIAAKKVNLGDSIALNGVCLTVAKHRRIKNGVEAYFELSQETLDKTTLGKLRVGDRINLEPALTLKDALGGHIVQGHVDGVGTVEKIRPEGEMKTLWFRAPDTIMEYIVPKGSVAVDGVSLTAVEVSSNSFSVALIPYTLDHTNMGRLQVGEAVNLEADIIAKYIMKYVKKP